VEYYGTRCGPGRPGWGVMPNAKAPSEVPCAHRPATVHRRRQGDRHRLAIPSLPQTAACPCRAWTCRGCALLSAASHEA
jgi:hypothetical protein